MGYADKSDESIARVWGDAVTFQDSSGHIRLLGVSASDHLLSMADALESRSSGAFSTYTLGRGALESAVRAWYLTDPTVEALERMRRFVNERLWGISEAFHFLKGINDESPDVLEQAETRIVEVAAKAGLDVRRIKRGRRYIGDDRPTIMQLCNLVLGEPAGRMAGFGSVTYRLLSSPAHGAEFGLAGRLQKTSSGASIPGKDSITLAKHLIWPLVAYVEMGDRRLAYFGWDDEPWRHERETTLRLWRGHAEIEIRD
jgi:hypothetical protein